MKKQYEKPATSVVQIRQLNQLLTSSPVQSTFTDSDPDDGWDSGGGR